MAETTISTSCFKAYDLRGRVPDELNEELAYRLGLVFAVFLLPENRSLTSQAVLTHQADVGLAWDGDFDCRLSDPQKEMATVEKYFSDPLRLNVESQGDRELMEIKKREILDLLEGLAQ